MAYENALNIYTDGSSLSCPRRGGIAVRYITIDERGHEVVQDETLTGYAGATNNEMELMASRFGLNARPPLERRLHEEAAAACNGMKPR